MSYQLQPDLAPDDDVKDDNKYDVIEDLKVEKVVVHSIENVEAKN